MTDKQRTKNVVENIFWGIIISSVIMIITFEVWM